MRYDHAAASGVVYESIVGAGDAVAYPPAGRLVAVGGYRLHLDCRRQGSPTVVMDAGLGGSSLDWTMVQPALARATQVGTYVGFRRTRDSNVLVWRY